MPAGRFRRLLSRIEDSAAVILLAAMALLPLVEIVARRTLGLGVPGSILIVQHLTFCLAFLGGGLAARTGRLLALSTGDFLSERLRGPVRIPVHGLGAGITGWLLFASLDLVRVKREAGEILTMGIPMWLVVAMMPAGLTLILLRLIARASERAHGRLLAGMGLLIPALLESAPSLQGHGALLPGLGLLLLGAILGLPLFATIGGVALLLFWNAGWEMASVPVESYRLTSFPALPAVPLFTLGGYVLAAGGASERLVRVFTALVGWLPGGGAIVTALVFAFFTSFTGASGVTILSLGGLLLPVLVRTRYPEPFSLGLVTVSGSIGLLFAPSLPVILYGVYSRTDILKLFLGGILPGLLLVGLVAALGVRQGLASGSARVPFRPREAAAAVWAAKWELLLPVVVLVGIFGGFATMVEAAALTVLYAVVAEGFIHGDISLRRDLPRAFLDSFALSGGFLIILGVALGLNSFLIFADVPTRALDWVQGHIASRWLFLLALNVFLLVVGGLMDIYSAIFVVVPLIAPMADAYGIDRVHLGIIFLANLELGYLTPPMGENLFLSSYRFNQPVMRLFRFTLPFYAALALGVLLITYWPGLTLWLAGLRN
jgi:tripartite ATP-independent transporter DctM subunit